MRLLVTGWQGQVARSLTEAAARRKDVEACAVGRPALDLCKLPTILRALADTRPDVVINTAAYTAVDKAESEPDAAFALNAEGAGLLAKAAADRNLPIIHLSTDYVFDGTKPEPYREDDETRPLGVYGRSKCEGEGKVAAANHRHLILRTAWVISPFGANFVKTMLRLAGERPRLKVVDDQHGSPTYAPHLADAILELAAQIGRKGDATPWGVYHAAGTGETTWCGLAREVFACSLKLGGPAAEVDPIATSGYPTPARRPANSRLHTGKLARSFGLSLPDWRAGVAECVERLVKPEA